MQSTKEASRCISTNKIAAAAKPREGMPPGLKAAIEAWAGPVLLVLLFVASLAYVALGGAFAPASAFDPEALIEALVMEPRDSGGEARKEDLLARSAGEKQ